MEVVYLTSKEVKGLNRIHCRGHNTGGSLYLVKDKLYKIFNDRYMYIDEKRRNIEYIYNAYLDNVPSIYALIYLDGEFYGYVEAYIKCAKTFNIGVSDYNLPYMDKVSIIRDVYKPIKQLHSENILLGDIHLDNFIYSKNKGYLIDLDDIRFKGDEFKFSEYYCLRLDKNGSYSKVATKNTDNIKACICCLSLLIGINLEEVVKEEGIRKVIEIIINYRELLTKIYHIDIDALCNLLLNKNEENVVYLDDLLGLNKREVKVLKRV